MIVDTFENASKYFSLNKRFEKAFNFILNTDFLSLDTGRYEIDGDNIYANVDEYYTKYESKPEYHKKYTDIQFLVAGDEKIGYCPINKLDKNESFNEEKDVGFGKAEVSYIHMEKGIFMILFPQDAHQPCMKVDNLLKVKKVVVKVKVD